MRRLLTVLTCLELAVVSCAPTPAKSPNVILLVVDTLRRDALPEYGFPLPTSGGMASFFTDSVRFERAYAPSSWTKPSVASLLTGLMPSRHLATEVKGQRLASALDLLPEVLSRHGWDTAVLSHNANVAPGTGFDQGVDYFSYPEGTAYSRRDVSEMMVEAHALFGSRRRRPLFLHLQPMNVHGPYSVPPNRQRDLLGRVPGRAFAYRGPLHRAIMEDSIRYRERVTEEMLISLRERYATAVRYTMDELARLIDILRQRHLYNDSLIILTSDHGEELYDHRGFGHGYTLFEEVVRIPLFIKLPGGERGGSIIRTPVSLIDLYPTILDLLKLPTPPDLDGRSLLGTIYRDVAADEEREILFEIDVGTRCTADGILRGRDKLIHIAHDYEGRSNTVLLFDLAGDPLETDNLLSGRGELASDLLRLLSLRLVDLAARAVHTSGDPAADADHEALKALGYL